MSARRLDTVLRVRAIREQIARGDVARQRMDLEQRCDEQARAISAISDPDRSSAIEAPLFLARRAALSGGVRDVDVATAATDVSREELDVVSLRWREAAQQLDGIDRLIEQMRAITHADDQRREANELDDLVVMRHTDGREAAA